MKNEVYIKTESFIFTVIIWKECEEVKVSESADDEILYNLFIGGLKENEN